MQRSEPVALDGSAGEGGGQILRTALSLSLVTGRAFTIHAIRAGRKKPGLLRQHLTAVEAAAALGDAHLDGAHLGSSQLSFAPRAHGRGVQHADRTITIGTAGSACLVLQTILPPLLVSPGRSRITIEGGTHNPLAPTVEHLQRAFVPLLRRMGATVDVALGGAGFYPAGGGRVHLDVTGGAPLAPPVLEERGALVRKAACALVANLSPTIGTRELRVLVDALGLDRAHTGVERVRSPGPGNALVLTLESEHVTEVVSAIGEKGVSAEDVGARVAEEAKRYLDAGVPVGEHLADQLLLPLALAGGGSFVTLPPTPHTRTNADVIARFLDVRFDFAAHGANTRVTCMAATSRAASVASVGES